MKQDDLNERDAAMSVYMYEADDRHDDDSGGAAAGRERARLLQSEGRACELTPYYAYMCFSFLMRTLGLRLLRPRSN